MLENHRANLHRIFFDVDSTRAWYNIIREANALYGRNWRGQPHVKRQLERFRYNNVSNLRIWFEVPDPKFATWVSVKHGVPASLTPNK
jgi:hypothetical protein